MSIRTTSNGIDTPGRAKAFTLARVVTAGACLVIFASFGTLVAIAGDDAGVREFLSRTGQEARPRPAAVRPQTPLPSLFVPYAPSNRSLLGYAPYESRVHDHPRKERSLARHFASFRFGERPRKRLTTYLGDRKPTDGGAVRMTSAQGAAGGVAYCVRLCDGYFFPVSQKGADAVKLQTGCNSLCPSAQTRLYSAPAGSEGIEHARFRGEAYTSLSTAFLHRTKVSKACSCTAVGYGLEAQDTRTDATFRRGDVLVMDDGLKVYRGSDPGRNRARDFVPLQTSTLLTSSEKHKLSELVLRTVPREPAEIASSDTRRATTPLGGLTPLKTQGAAGFEKVTAVGTVSLLRQDGIRNVYPLESPRAN